MSLVESDSAAVAARPHVPSSVLKLLAPALCCIATGLLISLLPVLLSLKKGQPAAWFADSDEMLYLSVASQSYFEYPFRLGDPVQPGGSGQSMYPWIQFAPGILPARFLHLGPLWISFFWRAFAGFSIGLGTFLVLWKVLNRPWLAAALTIWMLSDAGMATGQPLFQQFVAVRKLASVRGDYIIPGDPEILRLWRIITPGLSLGYLLMFLFAMLHLRTSGSRRAIAFAGVAFGLLFYIYFYYWTAAALALLICVILDKPRRRVNILAGLIGCIAGLPAIINGFLFKHSVVKDWFSRTNNFVSVPHLSLQIWFVIPDIVLMASLIWVMRRRRDLLPIWAVAFAGMVLTNHQMVTGLDIQNYHYIYVFGPVFSILALGMLGTGATALERQQRLLARCGVAMLCAGSLLTGLWLRAAEAKLTAVPLKYQEDLRHYLSQRAPAINHVGSTEIRLTPDSVIAGDFDFLNFAPFLEDQRPLTHYALIFSPSADNHEWDRRDALNAYLTGQTLEEFDTHQEEFFHYLIYGPWLNDLEARADRINRRLDEFRKIEQNPEPALREFRVKYIALNNRQKLPAELMSTFDILQNGPDWVIWRRRE